MREFFSLYRLLTRSGEIWWGEAIIVLCLLLLKHALRGLQMEPIAVMGAISAGLALIDKFYDLAVKVKGEEPGPHSFEVDVNKDKHTLEVRENGQITHEMAESDLNLGKFDQIRHDTLKKKIDKNWRKYNRLDEEIINVAVDEKIRLEQQMDGIRDSLCQDFRELVEIYEKVLGMSLPDHYTLYRVCS